MLIALRARTDDPGAVQRLGDARERAAARAGTEELKLAGVAAEPAVQPSSAESALAGFSRRK